MNKRWLSIAVCMIFLFSFFYLASAADISGVKTNIYYFHGIGCPHCANVAASGVLEKVANLSNVNMIQYEVYYDTAGRNKLLEIQNFLGIPEKERGIPLAVINCSDKYLYYAGDGPIIDNLMSSIGKCPKEGITSSNNNSTSPVLNNQLTFFAVVLGGLADAFNPCALGVLAFLMISLLKIGSAKRALKAGIIYSFVVFLVYIFAGLGIFRTIQSFTNVAKEIYLVMGFIVLVIGCLQLIDTFFPEKFVSLRIPVKAKPFIERVAQKGTLPAVIALGAIVALFELPCTGGIYLGILTLISKNAVHGVEYLILYNLLFILPLLIITYIIYKGTNPKLIESWSQGEKKWMKLVSGVVMIALAGYILKLAGVF